ncbi:MAG TPA: hypothetical protein VKP30_23995 [Polyangiaceae bacterium]|nr:hypothetical protein [Polyangiaceae bacterium]
MLTAIGLTAGEAFVVTFLAGFIITAHYWPRVGARLWIAAAAWCARRHVEPEK